jgi:hypothetical protein
MNDGVSTLLEGITDEGRVTATSAVLLQVFDIILREVKILH